MNWCKLVNVTIWLEHDLGICRIFERELSLGLIASQFGFFEKREILLSF